MSCEYTDNRGDLINSIMHGFPNGRGPRHVPLGVAAPPEFPPPDETPPVEPPGTAPHS
jgi:hypothetical protein